MLGGVFQLMVSRPQPAPVLSVKGMKARIRRALPGSNAGGRARVDPTTRIHQLLPGSFEVLLQDEFAFRTSTGVTRHFAHWVFRKN
jgi:hypothetical protein